MKFKLFTLLIISLFSFNSCDLLRFSRFEVEKWTPGDGYQPEPEKIIVSLKFSHEPFIASIERNFSLTGDGDRIRGTFSWNGKTMTFIPLTPFEENVDYILSLTADAHDVDGISMDEAFNREFTTRPDKSRPVLLSCYPTMYERIEDLRTEVRLDFSLPVTQKTLYDNVSFNPSMTGLWQLENKGKTAVFTPAEPWSKNTRYEIRFSTSLINNNAMNIGNDFLSIFTTGSAQEIPYLVNAKRITKDGEIIPLIAADKGYVGIESNPFENQDWEKNDKLILVFSIPVDSLSVKNLVSIDDGPNIIMETPVGFYTEIIFRFDKTPVYESRFSIRVKPGIKDINGNETKEEYIYRVFANGKFSKPPLLVGIRMPFSPECKTNPELKIFETDFVYKSFPISDDNYPSGENINTWIELYFDTAQSASIDLFSIMELFRIDSSNNVINFYPRQVKSGGFSEIEPHDIWKNYKRIEITGYLVNSTFFGIINFHIGAGLKDSFGNKNENIQKISVLK
ncbi:MAG: Ig-like domain-containing protein [Treponema sp.]|nr:Ig-like domain-containing protein [Treponema sp.]